jgi:hypothetical protein
MKEKTKEKNAEKYVKTRTEKAITTVLVVLVALAILIQIVVSMKLVDFEPYINFIQKIFGNTFS